MKKSLTHLSLLKSNETRKKLFRTQQFINFFLAFFILIASTQIANAITITWTGNANASWNGTNNWNPMMVPTAADDVIIPGGLTTYPIINSTTVNFAALTIENGGELNSFNSTCNCSTGVTIDAGGTLIFSSTTVISCDIANSGTIDWNGGVINGNDSGNTWTISNKNGANFNIEPTNAFVFNFNVINESGGTITKENDNSSQTLNGSFTNEAGGIVNVPGTRTLGFNKAVTNNGTMSGAGNYQFNTNNVSLAGNGTISNVLVNDTNLNVTGTQAFENLNFNVGAKVILGANDLTIVNIIAPSANNYIATTGNGRLIRPLSGATIFPIGPSTSQYSPVTLQGGTDEFGVNVKNGVTNAANNNQVVNVEWIIDRTQVISNTPTNVTLTWEASQESNTFDDSNCGVARWTGSEYETFGFGSATGIGDNRKTRTTDSPVTNFSPFVIGSAAALLPVELLNFDVVASDKRTALLTWRTATELNNEGFEIQRSSDSKNWETIGFEAGYGTTQTEMDYKFVDNRPQNSINYYRLKQMDYDGQFDYSPIRSVTIDNIQTPVSIFPNPVKDGTLTLQLENYDDYEIQINIYDLTGRKWLQQTSFATNTMLNVSDLSTGIYLMEIATNGQTIRQKIVIE